MKPLLKPLLPLPTLALPTLALPTLALPTLALLTLALTAGPGHAGPLADAFRARMAERQAKAEADAPTPPPARILRYGTDPAQTIAWRAPLQAHGPAHGPVPLVVFVHGGGWSHGSAQDATGRWKEGHFPDEGMAFASIDYRLVPTARVEDQAADIAKALAVLIAQAPQLGFDPHRVVLMGHSAGAHLVALVGTDPRWLQGAGLSFASLRGVVAIDGAAYDVPRQMAPEGDAPAPGRFMQKLYGEAFGRDPARQRALSPTLQAAAPNAPRFLLLHVQRPDGIAQARELAEALRAHGTPVEVQSLPGQGLAGHMEINRRLGDPTYSATALVDVWLASAFKASG